MDASNSVGRIPRPWYDLEHGGVEIARLDGNATAARFSFTGYFFEPLAEITSAGRDTTVASQLKEMIPARKSPTMT